MFWVIVAVGAIAFLVIQELNGWQVLRRFRSSRRGHQSGSVQPSQNWRSLIDAAGDWMPTKLFQQSTLAKKRKNVRRSQRDDIAGEATRLQPTPGINPRENQTQIQLPNPSKGTLNSRKSRRSPQSPNVPTEEPTRFQPLWEADSTPKSSSKPSSPSPSQPPPSYTEEPTRFQPLWETDSPAKPSPKPSSRSHPQQPPSSYTDYTEEPTRFQPLWESTSPEQPKQGRPKGQNVPSQESAPGEIPTQIQPSHSQPADLDPDRTQIRPKMRVFNEQDPGNDRTNY